MKGLQWLEWVRPWQTWAATQPAVWSVSRTQWVTSESRRTAEWRKWTWWWELEADIPNASHSHKSCNVIFTCMILLAVYKVEASWKIPTLSPWPVRRPEVQLESNQPGKPCYRTSSEFKTSMQNSGKTPTCLQLHNDEQIEHLRQTRLQEELPQ